MIGSEQFWVDTLRSHVAQRRAATGQKFERSPGLHPELRAALATFPNDWPEVGETVIPAEAEPMAVIEADRRETVIPAAVMTAAQVSVDPVIAAGAETVNRRRGGRPRRGSEAETLAHRRPWLALGLSRASWFRRRRL